MEFVLNTNRFLNLDLLWESISLPVSEFHSCGRQTKLSCLPLKTLVDDLSLKTQGPKNFLKMPKSDGKSKRALIESDSEEEDDLEEVRNIINRRYWKISILILRSGEVQLKALSRRPYAWRSIPESKWGTSLFLEKKYWEFMCALSAPQFLHPW